MFKIICFVLFTFCGFCSAYKLLLVFPYPNISNALIGEAFLRRLLNAGHQVTYITPYPLKNTEAFRQIPVTENIKKLPDHLSNIKHVLDKNIDLEDIRTDLFTAFKIANATVMNPDVQKLVFDIEAEFDAIIVDWMYNEVYSGFAAVFDCPLIWYSSMEPDSSVLKLLGENLRTTDHLLTQDLSFWQRVTTPFRILRKKFNKWLISDKENSVFNKAFGPAATGRGRDLPPFEEWKYKSSLILGNSHVTIDRTTTMPRNYVPVAGFHIEEYLLSQNLKEIMDNSNGVIIFCLGTAFKGSSLPDNMRTALLDVFKKTNRTVIWKYEGSFQTPENVHLMNWIPMPSVLAHPNCILMITSGGTLAITEAIHFSIPIIGVPIFRDQIRNVDRAVGKGFAKKIKLDSNISLTLKAAIDEVLNNSTYKRKVQALSTLYHDRPISASKELIFWIEHVIRTKGALHLRSPPPMLSWYQSVRFDLILATVVFLSILGVVIKNLLEQKRKENDCEYKKIL